MAKRLSVYLNNDDESVLTTLCNANGCSASDVVKTALRSLANGNGHSVRAIPGTFDIVETEVGKRLRLEKEKNDLAVLEREEYRKRWDAMWGEGDFDRTRERLGIIKPKKTCEGCH